MKATNYFMASAFRSSVRGTKESPSQDCSDAELLPMGDGQSAFLNTNIESKYPTCTFEMHV